jgi:hypothetical protein
VALGATLLTSSWDNVDRASYPMASVGPAANSFLIVGEILTAATTAGTASIADAFSGGSLTWTPNLHDLDGGRSGGIFTAQCGPTPGTGVVTISQTGGDATHTGAAWFLIEVTGASGAPVVQVKLSGGDGSTSAAPTGTLDAAVNHASNRVFSFWQHRANEVTTHRTNWTELGDVSGSAPNTGFDAQWRNDGTNETTFGCTYATSSRYIGMAIEIAAAPPFQPRPTMVTAQTLTTSLYW